MNSPLLFVAGRFVASPLAVTVTDTPGAILSSTLDPVSCLTSFGLPATSLNTPPSICTTGVSSASSGSDNRR